MNERYVRSYLKQHIDSTLIHAETRGTAIQPGAPEAIVWLGLDERASLQKLLPILVNSNNNGDMNATIGLYEEFASSDGDYNRIVTPVYTDNPARRALSLSSEPLYQVQSVTTSHPEVYSSEWSGVQEYADELAVNAQKSNRIKYSVGTPKESYVPLRIKIRAPGAIFNTKVPFFTSKPDTDIFHAAVKEMTIPCIAVSNSTEASDEDSFLTDVLLPFID